VTHRLLGRAATAAICLFIVAVVLEAPAAGGESATSAQAAAGSRGVVLLGSDPAAFAVLARRPTEIVLHFDRPIGAGPVSIRILADGGANEAAGAAFRPAGRPADVAERLRPLRPGVYLVAWQGPASGPGSGVGQTSGGYWFTVLSTGPNAHPPTSSGNIRALLAELNEASPSTAVTVLYWLARLLAAAATLVLVGLAAALSLVWPEGWTRRSSIGLMWAACGTLVLATAAGIGLRGLDGARRPLSGFFSWSRYDASLHTTAGHADIATWVLVVVTAALLQLLDQRFRQGEPAPAGWWKLATGAVGVALLAASALGGPGYSGRWRVVGLAGDFVHLGAASVWLGTLIVIVSAMGGASPPPAATRIARRASRLGLAAVVALAISGAVEAVRQGGGLDGLTSTSYGWLLVTKSIVGALAIVLALLVTRRLHRRRSLRLDQPRPAHRLILRSALLELLLLAGALGVTASLVGIEPAQEALSEPFGHVFPIGSTNVSVIVDPARVGADNTLHIYTLRPNGTPVGILEISGVLQLPADGIGPVTVPLINAGLAHFIATDIDLPVAGNWRLALTVHTGLTSTVAIVTTVSVR